MSTPATVAPQSPTAKPADTAGVPQVSAPKTAPAAGSEDASEPANQSREAGLSPGERLRVRSALLWSGDYTGSIGDGDPLSNAIKNFQKRQKSNVTGILSSMERANLLAAAQAHEDEFGWTVVVDPATGVRVGLPMKLVPHARDAAHGTHWSSPHGDVQVETFRMKKPDLNLAALFDQQKKEPSNRKVEFSVLHDDDFTITGMQGLKKFSVRAYARDGEIRGFTVLFDQMMATIVAPVTAAMTSAFSPFPERAMPFAAPAKPVEYGNGLVVSRRGHIVTDRKLTEGCRVIIAAGVGHADRVAEDEDTNLALLRVYGSPKVKPVAFASDVPRTGDVTLIGIPDPKEVNGPTKLTEVKARLANGNAIELHRLEPMAGLAGAAAIDAQGRVLGMMEMRSFVLASNEPSLPPVRLVSAYAIRAFLEANEVQIAGESTDTKAGIVRIICVRR
ncbi:MAG TPA: serine protease [Pseudolabrys sp.]|nr:serine protease [Pseudolabrys sp.]